MTTLKNDQLDRLVARTVAVYDDLQLELFNTVARNADIDRDEWQMLLDIGALRNRLNRNLSRLERAVALFVQESTTEAYLAGIANALNELQALDKTVEPRDAIRRYAVADRLAPLIAETAGAITATHPQILREVEDEYRRVVARVSAFQTAGAKTRRQAAQMALNEWADKGITAFIDRRGRRWDIRSYAEMALRSSSHRTAQAGYADQLTRLGYDEIVISDHSQECKLCRPWEGKVLSLNGLSQHPTLSQARSAGLMHPGCRHRFTVYFPGFTEVPKKTADPEGDQARQRQRYCERQVRRWKRREAAAFEPAAKAKARAKSHEWKRALRQHELENVLKRQPYRTDPRQAR